MISTAICMTAAILTTFLFALSAICGQRIAVEMGSLRANFWRLFIATTLLGSIVLAFWPDSLHRSTFVWLFASGIVGFGLGDIALFYAFERIGARLAILMNLCLAPIFAASVEYLWLGNGLYSHQWAAIGVILFGVALSIHPTKTGSNTTRNENFLPGIIAGMVAGFGQGCGAVISRRAQETEALLGIEVNGLSEAFQRVLAGFVVVAIVFAIRRPTRPPAKILDNKPHLNPRRLSLLLLGAALFGPVIGVSCFQWALQSMESALVLSVVATAPILIIPMAWHFDGERPPLKTLVGAIIAVQGVIYLQLNS
ncbi:MAG: DMT family transporter [Verrucomicrobia bacterium]|nr:DMT family transporter [Verrucomicrobiota bacterium]